MSKGLTRLLGTLHSEIVDHHTEVGISAREDERRSVDGRKPGVDTCEDALRGSFLVSGGAYVENYMIVQRTAQCMDAPLICPARNRPFMGVQLTFWVDRIALRTCIRFVSSVATGWGSVSALMTGYAYVRFSSLGST